MKTVIYRWILLLLAVAGVAITAAASPTPGLLDSLDAVRSRVRLGAEIFLDPGYTSAEIQHHFARMREVGLTVARMFIIWDHVEKRPGEWRFDLYDQAYDAAAANGIAVLTTLCPEDPPGWMRRTTFYHHKEILNTPEARARSAEYLRRVVSRYKDHPAQGPWSLANEPGGLPESFDIPTLRQFGEWLRRKYGTVDAVNARWFQPIASFEDIPFPRAAPRPGWIDHTAWLDWKWFRIQQQSDQLAWVRDEVRRYDSRHPTHANPTSLARNMPVQGADLWSEKQVLDFLGTTVHASWLPAYVKTADLDLTIAFIADLMRSGSGGAPWWITELQSGLSLFGARPLNPSPDELTRWIWDGVGAGTKGVIFWCWHPRRFGNEAGEWGLVRADGSATPRSDAVARLAPALDGSAAFLHQAEPLPARVAILYSRQALIQATMDEREPKGADCVMASLLGCHRALTERQIPVDFINEDDLRSGRTGRYAALYLPYDYVLDDAGSTALRRYVADGGTLWADGPLAWKDDLANTRPDLPGSLTDVFGVEATDVLPAYSEFREGASRPFALTPEDTHAGDTLRLPLLLRGAEAIARDAAGEPVATRHRFGKGTAIFFGTALAAGYQRHPDPKAGEWIAAAAGPIARAMDVSVAAEAPRLFFRGMRCPSGLVAILTNPGDTCSVRVTFRGSIDYVEDGLTGQRLEPVTRDGSIEVAVDAPAGGVAILLARSTRAAPPAGTAR